MKLKYLFPFSSAEYLKVFACYLIFFAVLFSSLFIISSYTASLPFSAAREAAAGYVVLTIAILVLLILLNFFIFSLMIAFAYSQIAKIKFRWKLFWKFILAFLMLLLIFIIPWLFSIRLASDKNPAAIPIFIIVFLAILHFSNFVFLFTALTGKTIQGIKKGFSFGTLKIRKLLVPYVFVAIALAVFSAVMRLLAGFQFLNLILSGILMSWMALFVCRIAIKRQAERK